MYRGFVSLLRSLDWFVNGVGYKHSAPPELNAFRCEQCPSGESYHRATYLPHGRE